MKRYDTLDGSLLKWKNKFHYLELDVRSLSLFRIVLGVSLLYNLIIIRWNYAVELLGKDRIVPIDIMHKLNGTNAFSVFDIIQNNNFAFIYLLLTILSAGFYTIGYKTKFFSWITLFLYWNILQATSSYCFGFDFYTFQLLFWSCFLPLDNFFSVSKKVQIVKPYFSVTFVLLFQIVCVYFFTGLAKYGISWKGGYAVHNMLMDNWATLSPSSLLIDKPYLYKPLTYATLLADILFPFLIFIPSPRSVFRYVIVVYLIGFHLCIFLMYNVGNFSITGFAAATVLLPSDFWDRFHKTDKKIISAPHNRWNYVLILFCLVSIYIITVKNLVFSTKYTAAKDWKNIKDIKSFLSKVDVTAPVKVSFFIQNWKMFAPNPPLKLGWMSLEIKKEDGFYYDLLTNQLITDVPTIYWYPSGYEGLIIKYSRNYVYPASGDKYKIFLKYWIPYVIKKKNIKYDSIKILFVDYVFFSADQSTPFVPPLKKVVIPADSITGYKPFGMY